MGRTHALTGLLAGLVVGQLVGLDDTVVEPGSRPESMLAACAALGPFAATVAGYAVFPDLDHRSSSATRLLGPITGLLSRGLRASSEWVYQRARGPADSPDGGEHRALTHTLVFALALGSVCAATTALWGIWAVLAWLGFGLLLAIDRLGPIALAAIGVSVVAWLPTTLHSSSLPDGQALRAAIEACSGWLGLAVALGCITHCLGDALTESGCAFLFPLPIAGETWYELRPPAILRFRTGRRVERILIFPLVAVGCVLAIPGLVSHLVALLLPLATAGGGLA